MADNYLEKKMEELRSGRYSAVGCTTRAGSRRKALSYPCRELRVLIAGTHRKYLKQYAGPFMNLGCRISIISPTDRDDTDLGKDSGIRYYRAGTSEEVRESLMSLIKAWRDIDVVVVLDSLPGLAAALEKHVSRLPYPNDWGMPVITVNDGRITRTASCPQEPVTGTPDIPGRQEAGAIPWLALNTNNRIAYIQFK